MDDIRDNNTSGTSEETTGQYGQYGQQGQYGQYRQTPETLPPVVPPKKKSPLPVIITIIVLVAIFGIAIATLAPSYMQARKFGKAIVSGKNIDDAVEMAFPEKLIKDRDDMYDTCKSAIQKSSREIKIKGNPSFLGVKTGKKIKSKDCRNIEKYYNFLCTMAGIDEKVKIQKGYEYKIKFKTGGTKYYMECVLIKMKGEGWKVFPASLDELDEFSSYLK